MRIDVIANTTARLYQTRPALLDQVRGLAAGTASVHPTADLAELDRAIAAIAARGSDLVILSGGDGSFMAGVTALARAFGEDRLPPIALLPGGTVATIARNWGMSGDPAALLQRILARRRELPTIVRPTLRVRATRAGEVEERIGFIFGTGLVAKFFDLYYADGARGYEGAARIAARVFAASFYGGAYARRVLDPIACTLAVEGRTLAPGAWSLVVAAVVRDLGLRMRVTWRAGEDPDRLHLVASPLAPEELGPRAPRVILGRSIGGAGHVDELARAFDVRFPGPEPGPYVLDGDALAARSIAVSPGPKLRVVAPPAG